jgi:hypothetical protein
MISGMTEREAIRLYQRLMGVGLGSVLDPLLVEERRYPPPKRASILHAYPDCASHDLAAAIA